MKRFLLAILLLVCMAAEAQVLNTVKNASVTNTWVNRKLNETVVCFKGRYFFPSRAKEIVAVDPLTGKTDSWNRRPDDMAATNNYIYYLGYHEKSRRRMLIRWDVGPNKITTVMDEEGNPLLFDQPTDRYVPRIEGHGNSLIIRVYLNLTGSGDVASRLYIINDEDETPVGYRLATNLPGSVTNAFSTELSIAVDANNHVFFNSSEGNSYYRLHGYQPEVAGNKKSYKNYFNLDFKSDYKMEGAAWTYKGKVYFVAAKKNDDAYSLFTITGTKALVVADIPHKEKCMNMQILNDKLYLIGTKEVFEYNDAAATLMPILKKEDTYKYFMNLQCKRQLLSNGDLLFFDGGHDEVFSYDLRTKQTKKMKMSRDGNFLKYGNGNHLQFLYPTQKYLYYGIDRKIYQYDLATDKESLLQLPKENSLVWNMSNAGNLLLLATESNRKMILYVCD